MKYNWQIWQANVKKENLLFNQCQQRLIKPKIALNIVVPLVLI
jgi:hypothetical protein